MIPEATVAGVRTQVFRSSFHAPPVLGTTIRRRDHRVGQMRNGSQSKLDWRRESQKPEQSLLRHQRPAVKEPTTRCYKTELLQGMEHAVMFL